MNGCFGIHIMWLLLGGGYYIAFLMKLGWEKLQVLWADAVLLNVWVDGRTSKSLLEGLTAQLEHSLDPLPGSRSRGIEI